MNDSGWCTIESDPGVFTELVESMGVSGVAFREIYSLEDESIKENGSDVYGLIFLFKYQSRSASAGGKQVVPPPFGMFYAKQVIQNACATQAILNVLLNTEGIRLGALEMFKEFTLPLDAELRGETIGNSPEIRAAHNSFRPPVSFDLTEEPSRNSKEASFHFVSYIYWNEALWELDGLAGGVIRIATAKNRAKWLSLAIPAVQARIAEYTDCANDAREIRFNLMAVERDSIPDLDPKSVAAISLLETRQRWKKENLRRRHNWTPLILASMKHMAEDEQLVRAFQFAQKESIKQRCAQAEK